MDGEEAKAQWQSAYRVADFITKPFDFSDLLKSIKRVLAAPENS
jgi:FixJ family two-component response regulator